MKQLIRVEIGLSILFLASVFFLPLDWGMVSANKPAAPVTAKRTAPAANVPVRGVAPKAAPKTDKAPASNKPGTRTQPAGRPVTRGAAKKPATRAGPVVKASAKAKKAKKKKKSFFEKFLPILILLIVVTFIIARLPPPDFGGLATDWRTAAFRQRRVLNWLPLGLTYAFLYMGRYNLKISKFAFESIKGSGDSVMMSNQDFGIIFAAGTVVYGMSFLINGPMTDRLGGKFAILVGAAGSCVMNFLMGLASWSIIAQGPMHGFIGENFVVLFSVLYAGNMYFQSFGAVAIVKVNASWFHVRERGVFGAIFGILISLGIYFAFDIGSMILKGAGVIWVFFVPAALLAIFWVIDFMLVRDTPGQAGLQDFDTADASSGDDGPQLGAIEVFKLMLKNPVIVTIALIEFCSGFLRQAIMQWYRTFAKQTDSVLGLKSSFVYENWGMLLCIAGITGGVIAGIISDRVFQSRRGPVAGLLYGVMFIGGIGLIFAYTSPIVGGLVIVLSMAVIGVHGMLSGTASMDFGGRKNVGVAVGIIDGFVYLGTAVMSLTYAFILPKEQIVDGKLVGPALKPENWIGWPVAMVPIALIGFLLALRVWNARPQPKSKPPKAPEAAEAA